MTIPVPSGAVPRRVPLVVRDVLVAVVPALLLGVAAADGWRTGIALVSTLGSLHTPWALLPFAVGWWCGRGRPGRGVGLGLLAGFSAIAGYYLWEWVAYSAHAATAQLTKTGGAFWVAGATLGGGVFGGLGATASPRAATRRPVAGAAVLLTAAVPVAELALVAWFRRRGWAPDDSALFVGVLGVLAAGLLALAWRRAPRLDFLRAATLACVPAGVALELGLWAESHFAYLTL